MTPDEEQRFDDTFNTLFESGEYDRASIKTHHIFFDADSFILVKDKSREEAKRSFMICDRIGTKMKEMEIEGADDAMKIERTIWLWLWTDSPSSLSQLGCPLI